VAARRYCDVTGIDYVPALLERAKQRAAAEGTPIDFRLGDAQALPFPDGSFDVVLSTFGVMFAPNQEAAAAEILRVCRPGASIGMANWVPEGGIADFFRVHSQYAPPPPGLESPTRWGTEAGLRELLGAGTRSIETRQCVVTEHFRSIDHAVAVFRDYFGPTRRALDQLDLKAREALLLDLTALLTRLNRAKDGTVALPFEYVEVVAHLR
jgi:SAM-dependent methyltransferase